ncbi:hypothetical protein PanWU01x14_008160 [Parasponia andersonii]|uniref:Uncharacterized protein n=1 Tax=Parasponia andersonii TaxID=3476 RepID=A0A2P5E4A0_PARAD|nr:hypothetical protein PanWU01x14_008160 [Parasponia andersonii]
MVASYPVFYAQEPSQNDLGEESADLGCSHPGSGLNGCSCLLITMASVSVFHKDVHGSFPEEKFCFSFPPLPHCVSVPYLQFCFR